MTINTSPLMNSKYVHKTEKKELIQGRRKTELHLENRRQRIKWISCMQVVRKLLVTTLFDRSPLAQFPHLAVGPFSGTSCFSLPFLSHAFHSVVSSIWNTKTQRCTCRSLVPRGECFHECCFCIRAVSVLPFPGIILLPCNYLLSYWHY